jgi:hypothetical protein
MMIKSGRRKPKIVEREICRQYSTVVRLARFPAHRQPANQVADVNGGAGRRNSQKLSRLEPMND